MKMRRCFAGSICLILSLVALLAAAEPVSASTGNGEQISAWAENVDDARKLLAQPGSELLDDRIAELEAKRLQLATQRDKAFVASREPSFEARVVERELYLLGPVPPDGESEFAASKRQELEEELYDLKAPQRTLQDSYLRSATTIDLLDEEIEDLRFQKVMARGQSPLWPGSWIAFLSESQSKSDVLVSSEDLGSSPLADNVRPIALVLAIVIALAGAAAITIGRKALLKRIYSRIAAAKSGRKTSLLAIGYDFAGLVVSLAGVGIIAVGGILLILLYPGSARLPTLIFLAGIPVVLTHWLAATLFAPNAPKLRLVDLGAEGGRKAIWLVVLLGVALGGEAILEAVETRSPYSAEASGVAPLMVLGLVAGALFLLARTIEQNRHHVEQMAIAAAADSEDEEFIDEQIDWTKLLTGAMKLSAIVSILLALIGYSELGRFAILPTIESLIVAAILVTIYARLTALIQQFAPEQITGSKNSITALRFLLAIAFLLAAAPIMALIWGIRPAEILDFAVLLRDGVTIGGTTISLGTILVFVTVFVIGYILTRWVQRALQTMLLSRLEMDDGTRSAIVTGSGYVGVVLAFLAAIGAAGIDLSNLAIIFGALSVGIGFGMQSVVSNFVSGIIMLVERPIKEGDSIEVGGYAGIVDKISVRATRIQSFDHDDVIIPNSELISGTVRNRTLTDRMTRIECSVGIAYDSDVHAAFDILHDIARSHERTVQDPPPSVVMEQLGDSALMLRIYCFIDEVGQARATISEMYVDIVRRFAEKGISIPFPQREVAIVSNPPRPSDDT